MKSLLLKIALCPEKDKNSQTKIIANKNLAFAVA